MTTICETMNGCDGGIWWQVSYRDTDAPYVEVEFDNFDSPYGIELRVNGDKMPAAGVKLTFRGLHMLKAFAEFSRFATKRPRG